MKDDDEIDRLGEILAKKHYTLKKEWLKTCVEFLEVRLGEKLQSTEQLMHLVIHQFLNSEISTTLSPVMNIPTGAVKVFIVKKMIFQMTSYLNVSKSVYEQLTECTRSNDDLKWFHGGFSKFQDDEENGEKDTLADQNNNKEMSWKKTEKKRGILKLELTDGVNKVKGLELEEIFDEKLLIPGVKIMLTGKVKCRRGTLLLDKSNCQILGGQVDSLKFDKIKQWSELLKIDLDAEKNRRKESLEKAAENLATAKQKRLAQKSLNQSSISPFLVKKDRKTGETTQNPILPKATSFDENDMDCSEVAPVQEPTPQPPEMDDNDPILDQFTWNSDQRKGTKKLVAPAPKITAPTPKIVDPEIADHPKRQEERHLEKTVSNSFDEYDMGCSGIAPVREPTPEPPENAYYDPILDQFTWNLDQRKATEKLVAPTPKLTAPPSKIIAPKITDQLKRQEERNLQKTVEMKTDRKTGKTRQNPTSFDENDMDCTEDAPVQEPTREPHENADYDPILEEFTWNSDNRKGPKKLVALPPKFAAPKIVEHPKRQEERNLEKTVEDWTFTSANSFSSSVDPEKVEKIEKLDENTKYSKYFRKPPVKQLPEQLLTKDDISEPPRAPKVSAASKMTPWETTEQAAKKKQQKSDYEWDRKGSEEEDFLSKKSMVLPSCFLTETTDRHDLDSRQKSAEIAKTIHGPRRLQVEEQIHKEKLRNAEKMVRNSPKGKITAHFSSVKNSQSAHNQLSAKPRTRTPSANDVFQDFEKSVHEMIENEREAEDKSVEDMEIVESILSQIQQKSAIPPPASTFKSIQDTAQFTQFSTQEHLYEEPRNYRMQIDDSILECTMDREGRRELQRWGLMEDEERLRRKRDAEMADRRTEWENCILEKRKPDVEDYASLISRSQYPTQQFSQYATNLPQNYPMTSMEGHERIRQHYPPVAVSHEPPPPPPLRIKTESIEDEDRNNPTTMLVRRSRKLVDRDGESKIRQSTNVQIYKTPYAKRIHSNDQSMSASEEIVRRLSDLNIVPLGDALANRKYWMMSKIVVVMPTICHQVHEIKSDGVDWQLQIRVSDTSASDVICLVATDLLNRIFGFTAQQCKKLFDAKKFHELHVKRAEAERKLMGFNRLDLLVWLEIPTELDKFPLVLDVKTISDALNIL